MSLVYRVAQKNEPKRGAFHLNDSREFYRACKKVLGSAEIHASSDYPNPKEDTTKSRSPWRSEFGTPLHGTRNVKQFLEWFPIKLLESIQRNGDFLSVYIYEIPANELAIYKKQVVFDYWKNYKYTKVSLKDFIEQRKYFKCD